MIRAVPLVVATVVWLSSVTALVARMEPLPGSQGQGLARGHGGGSSGTHCTVSATPLSFGRYRVFDVQALDSTAQITVACSAAKLVHVALSPGLGGSYTRRFMTGPQPTDQLVYQVYADQARNRPFGDGSNGTTVLDTVSIKSTLTVYGRVTPLQKVPAGSYSDQLLVTIHF